MWLTTTYTYESAVNQPVIALRTIQTPQEVVKAKIREFGGKTAEIALAIIKSESDFKNVCNYKYTDEDGKFTACGLFQLTIPTWQDECSDLGDPIERKDEDKNIQCGMRLLEKGQAYRWIESYDKWFPNLSEDLQAEYVDLEIRCSCVKAVRSWGVDIPMNTNADEIISNSLPTVGGGILFSYEPNGHIGQIMDIKDKGFYIRESNRFRCSYSERWVAFDDPFLRGFYSP